jgi:hypothetical protein
MNAPQRLAPLDHFVVPALPLQAEELQQQPHCLLGRRLQGVLNFVQQVRQAGLFCKHPGREPRQVAHVAITLNTRVESLAQSFQQRVGELLHQLIKAPGR